MTTPAHAVSGSASSGADCGCGDFTHTRRTFLKGLSAAAGAGVLTSTVGEVFTQTTFGAEADGNVLVVLSLRGGCDGLSLVVPYADPGYTAARPTIAIPESALLAKDAMFGLHPQFAPLQSLWDAGSFAAVHAVGLPQPNRSHFSAMEEIEDAHIGSSARVGWINRMVGDVGGGRPNQAIELGSSLAPTEILGRARSMAVGQLSDIQLPGAGNGDYQHRLRRALHMMWDRESTPMGHGIASTLTTTTQLKRLATSTGTPKHGASYPDSDLAKALADTARLVRAKVGTQVVTIDYGSWDMHTFVGGVSGGQMHDMVAGMASALAAFFTDLGSDADRVTVVTISEFGRTVAENASQGLDHGYGNCMLLLGAGVRGGRYYGRWPGLGDDAQIQGDLGVTHDYRSVLTEVVTSRFHSASRSRIFPGFHGSTLNLMR